jgi:peroxiredoxin Q/BCP
MLRVGDNAPDFEFAEGERTQTLRGCLSAGPVVLYFYPADFTPVCTKEACMFRDKHADLVATGVRVLGVSPQGEDSHRKFRERHRLPFTLIADPSRRIIKAYGVGGMFGLPVPFGTRRVTYLIGTDGRIADMATGEFGLTAHARFAERALAKG